MTAEEIYQRLQERFGDQILGFNAKAVDPSVRVAAAAIHEVAEYLRHDPQLQFDLLMCLSGVDYGPGKHLEVVYHLFSMSRRHKIVLKVEVPRQGGEVPTVCDIWRTAEWHEREVYDLFGIRFAHHPDLRRILLPDDWEGHPLLKDYQVQEFYHGVRVPYVGDPPQTGLEVYRTQEQEP
ncbi:MAG: NADH-quinone oxidoreductase subunit C [Candidatus Tectimicrobiota bacterium]|nr:MAG: NADH-quinone oxidoreductase subunit C [Candidatus Tectomicrobia bacterium]